MLANTTVNPCISPTATIARQPDIPHIHGGTITPENFVQLVPVHHLIFEYLQDLIPAKMVRLSREISESTLTILFRDIEINTPRNPFANEKPSHFQCLKRKFGKIQQTRSLHLRNWESVTEMKHILLKKQSRLLLGQPEAKVMNNTSGFFPNLKHLHLSSEVFQELLDELDGIMSGHRWQKVFDYHFHTQEITLDISSFAHEKKDIDIMVDLLSKTRGKTTFDPKLTLRCAVSAQGIPIIPNVDMPYNIIFQTLEGEPENIVTPGKILEILWYNILQTSPLLPKEDHFENAHVIVLNLDDVKREINKISKAKDLNTPFQRWCRDLKVEDLFVVTSIPLCNCSAIEDYVYSGDDGDSENQLP